jgi:hypothetical protein
VKPRKIETPEGQADGFLGGVPFKSERASIHFWMGEILADRQDAVLERGYKDRPRKHRDLVKWPDFVDVTYSDGMPTSFRGRTEFDA